LTPTIFFLRRANFPRAEYGEMAISLAYLSSGRRQKKDNKTNNLFLPPPPPLLKIFVKKNNRPQTSPYVWWVIVRICLLLFNKPSKSALHVPVSIFTCSRTAERV